MVADGQRRVRGASAVLGLTLLAAGLTPGAARAAGTVEEGSTRTDRVCSVGLGSVTPGGDHLAQEVRATTPITVTQTRKTTFIYSGGGNPRLSSYFTYEPGVAGDGHADGLVVQRDGMYQSTYDIDPNGAAENTVLKRIGAGWDRFTAMEQVQYQAPSHVEPLRRSVYALRDDGLLFRWNINMYGVWRPAGSAAGFSSVKSFTLISKNYSYDTFLANTRGGALYTIRIPTTATLKPVVTMVRSRTWQGFETLIAQSCSLGEVVVAIDKDTSSAYLYAIGHANGAATPIQGRGKIPGTFANPVYFRWGPTPANEIFNGD